MIFYSTFVEAPKKLCRLNQQHWIEIQIDVLKQQQQKLQYSRVGHRVIIQTFPLKGMPISLQGLCMYYYNTYPLRRKKNVDIHLTLTSGKKCNYAIKQAQIYIYTIIQDLFEFRSSDPKYIVLYFVAYYILFISYLKSVLNKFLS